MKKTFHISIIYLCLSLICGIFYREITKAYQFQGTTAFSYAHVHLFALGTLLFLVLTIFCITSNLAEQKNYKRFLVLYNIALPGTVIMMMIRGIIQIQSTPLALSMNATISGIAGLFHILLAISFLFLFLAIKNIIKSIENKNDLE